MYDNDNIFFSILDMCGNLNVDELKDLIENIKIMIDNLESEEE